MVGTGPKRIVVNANRFLIDICPVVLEELGQGGSRQEGERQADPELYSVIRDGGHKIVLTDAIRVEYEYGAISLPPIQWLPVIRHLQSQGLIINPRMGANRGYQGIPQRHNTFPITAIRANAHYLITERNVWLDRADAISQHGPEVITPGRFVQTFGAH